MGLEPRPSRLLLGIDVGWSAKRPTCALAVRGAIEVPGGRARRFGRNIAVGVYRLDDLLAELPGLVSQYHQQFAGALLVIDGPVGPQGLAVPIRPVDAAFAQEGFSLRAPAYPITHGSGLQLAAVTERILASLANCQLRLRPWLGGDWPTEGVVVVETNPTVAMAVLAPQQEIDTLPSRTRTQRWGGALIRAKSDWYWRLAGAQYAACALGEPTIASETDHERVAGLFALALAAGLDGCDGVEAPVCVGDSDGVYLVPGEIDETWRVDIDRVGVHSGTPTYAQRSVGVPPDLERPAGALLHATPVPRVTRAGPRNETVGESAPIAARAGACTVRVVLNDNGGLNLRANPWLESIPLPFEIWSDSEMVFTVQATFRDRLDMFVVSPTTLSVARRRGFKGRHLSKSATLVIDAETRPRTTL